MITGQADSGRSGNSKTAGSSASPALEPAEDYSVYRLSCRDFLKEGTVGVSAAALAAYAFYRSFFVFLILLPAALIAYPLLRRPVLKEKRAWQLTVEFREAIWTMSGYMNAGLSAENALIKTLPELEHTFGDRAMIVKEWRRMIAGIRVNVPLEKLLADFALRSDIEDIRNFAEVFALVKRNGGSMKHAVEDTTGVIRDKTAVMEEIKNMTASRRYEQNIMNIIPFAIIMYINVSSGDYLDVMYDSPAGRLVMTFCLFLLGVSYISSRKILDIRV